MCLWFVLGGLDCWLLVVMIVFTVWCLFYECLGFGVLVLWLLVDCALARFAASLFGCV